MTNEQKARLNEVSTWTLQSFPNGSLYALQSLPEGNFGDVRIIRRAYEWMCYFARGEAVSVGFSRRSIGRGVDVGPHFCSRDQAIIGLL